VTATIGGMTKAKPTVQMTLRLEPELFEAIQEAARLAGKPVVAWMSEAAREKMTREGKR
jgi:predicted HicB family RNase H-like nuclease